MTLRSLLLLASATLLAAAPGCALGTQRYGKVIDASLISQVKIGTTTKQEVLDLFGPPADYSRIAGTGDMTLKTLDQEWQATFPLETAKAAEDVFTYEYREEPETFFSLLLFTWFTRDVLTDRLMVFFDTKDLVKFVAFTKETDAEHEVDEEDEAGE
jgi:hypothetical protein